MQERVMLLHLSHELPGTSLPSPKDTWAVQATAYADAKGGERQVWRGVRDAAEMCGEGECRERRMDRGG